MKKGMFEIVKSSALFLLILLAISTGTVLAEDDAPPPDPGAGSTQDGIICSTAVWVMNVPQVFTIAVTGMDYLLNWASLDFITTSTLADGQVEFIGAGYSSLDLLDTDGDGSLLDENNDVLTPSYCGDAWVTPGLISLEAFKNFPMNAVVVGQDPESNGVNLTWVVRLFPTAFNYEAWELTTMPQDPNSHGSCKHLNAECLINQSYNPCCEGTHCEVYNQVSGNGKCVDGPATYYACTINTSWYPEEFVTVNTAAVLTIPSREWIMGPLTLAYPGSHLKHPEWGFLAGGACVWEGDVCVLTHSEDHVQVVDPGFYDLSVTGVTSGTEVSPPRTFGLVGGQFDVFLLENSIVNSQ